MLARVEHFMADYYRAAQNIYRVSKLIEERLALSLSAVGPVRGSFRAAMRAALWVETEWDCFARLWSAGAGVHYPLQRHRTEVMLVLLGAEDTPAPRLTDAAPSIHRAAARFLHRPQVWQPRGALVGRHCQCPDLAGCNVRRRGRKIRADRSDLTSDEFGYRLRTALV